LVSQNLLNNINLIILTDADYFATIGPLMVLILSIIFSTFSYASTPLKVLSLNFNSEEVAHDHPSTVRDLRVPAATKWIKEHDVDVIMIQEGWNYKGDASVAKTLARELDYDVVFRVSMGFPGYFLDSNAIIAKKSLHMSERKKLKLPHSSFEIGDGKKWVIELGRVSYAIGAKLTLPGGEPLFVYSTHLIAKTLPQRADQLKAISDEIESQAADDGLAPGQYQSMIAGDFNSAPGDEGPVFMRSAGYVDSFEAVHPGDKSCTDCADTSYPYFNPYTIAAGLVPSQAADKGSERVDYVFSRGSILKPLASTLVFTTPLDGVWMSDHYGIFTTFGDASVARPANPVCDSVESENPAPVVVTLTEDLLNSDHVMDALEINGARGVVFENNTGFKIHIQFHNADGNVFSKPKTTLKVGERAAFSFNEARDYPFVIHVQDRIFHPHHRGLITGMARVLKTGY
jgi:endonuclease/exonuclease/phosphatase family metal-dependent hydrolase